MSASSTVMTFNLLEDQHEDSLNSWDKRKDLCIAVITSYSPVILCTQQASGVKSQLEYLQQCLPGYEQFGISRKGSQDQYCTIFYDKEKVELLERGTFRLSESPSVPGSISWGSIEPCISTWAIPAKRNGATRFPISTCLLYTVGVLIHKREHGVVGEGYLAQCPSEEKSFLNPHLPWIQRYKISKPSPSDAQH